MPRKLPAYLYKKDGPPLKLDQPEIREKLKAIAVLDITVEAMCAHAGITPQTYYNYVKTHPEFLQEIEDIRQTPYIDAVTTVTTALKSDPKIALAWLERKKKLEYSVRSEITGAEGTPLITGIAALMQEAEKVLEQNGEPADS